MDTKAFPTHDVLSTITGRLIGEIGGVYEMLNWMTGESVYTHQLPRIGREAQALLVSQRPELQQAVEEAEQVTRDNWRQWRAMWETRYGPTIAVPKFTEDTHERIDPLSELAEKVHPSRITVIGR